ncbi:hypothetical protein [Dongia sp.]|uniref:hypothetical protein n=1 Tax=Dongia sp. TaxID=1977262 RepID=UPI0035B21A11
MHARYAITSLPATSLLVLGLLLAACNPHPAPSALAQATPPDPAPEVDANAADLAPPAAPESFGGRWFVSAVYPTGNRVANIGDPHLGVSLVIDADEVSDVNGQRCNAPEWASGRSEGDIRFGAVALSGIDQLTVTCKGKAFATYLLLPGRKLDAGYGAADAPDVPFALIADRPEAYYLLERAEQVLHRQASLPAALAGEGKMVPVSASSEALAVKPVAPAQKPAAPAAKQPEPTLQAPLVLAPAQPVPATPEPVSPMPVSPEPVAAKPAAPAPAKNVAAAEGSALPAPGAAIHLASYSGISAAKRGWKTLLGEFDALDPLSPLYVNVDVPGKGAMIRLYATGGDAAALKQACGALAAKGAYCVLSR